MRIVPAVVLLLLFGSLARADEGSLLGKRYVGARIGGYGFRRPQTEGGGWNDCRMNGVGIFGQQALPAGFFLEAGLDAYFADDLVVAGAHEGDEEPMDRASALSTVAGGARLWPDGLFSPYVHAGLGLEVTRVRMHGFAGTFALPLGFFGVGGDLRLGRFRLGAVLRVHAMGHFQHDGLETELHPEPELATQGQFYALMSL